jgi:hypothetical protein
MLDERRKLKDAGWVPEEHLGKSLWRRPQSGYCYPQEVAIALIEEVALIEEAAEGALPAQRILAEESSSGALRSERHLPPGEEEELVEDHVIVGGVIAVAGVTLMALSVSLLAYLL